MTSQPYSLPAVSLTVSGTPMASSEARHWTTGELVRLGIPSPGLRDDVELVVSELVSNAVQHGVAPIVVTLSYENSALMVSVADTGGPPYAFEARPDHPTASHGRGLAIVATIAIAWGIRALVPGPGKDVWCRLGHDLTGNAP